MPFPDNLDAYTDVYFLRSRQILQALNLNPFVRAQVFLRQGPGQVFGLTEVKEIIRRSSQLEQHGGRVWSLEEGQTYQPLETVLILEGPAQDLLTLETVILGVITAETTTHNDHHAVKFAEVTEQVKRIKQLIGDRPVYYFGARHWHYDQDAEITAAAFAGGAAAASTDIGAATHGQKGIGTVPHSLENIFAWKYGPDQAVLESIKAFDQVMPPPIPRVALVDYRNREVDDALAAARALGSRLSGVRVDTCGENVMQGTNDDQFKQKMKQFHDQQESEFWFGRGVSVSGVYALRRALSSQGFSSVQIILSSGFGKLEKVKAFVSAEEQLQIRLFDALGVGNLFPARIATMDVVSVGEDIKHLQACAKVGRKYKPNSRLKKVLG